MKVSHGAWLISLLVLSGSAVAHQPLPTAALQKVTLHIEPQPVGDALSEFGRQTGLTVMIQSVVGRGVMSPKLDGNYTPVDALDQLLTHTGLHYEYLDDKTVAVLGSQRRAANAPIRVALVERATPDVSETNTAEESNSKKYQTGEIEEILVTAQKRAERLQDVPVPVTAINADKLIDSNQLRLQDYYTSVPGLTVAPIGTQSYQLLSIRGITTGGGSNPTVGVTVDDVPYGSSTNLGGGTVVPDIDPGDLARVEVLRGPQGTLYGAGSMGGLLKFVTLDPSTDRVSGSVQAGLSSVHNGAQLGYNVRGSINAPLSDVLAVRATGFTRQEPGYIDNPVLSLDGVNKQRVSGGRLAALWRPSDAFSLKLSALYQTAKADGSSDVDSSTVAGYSGPPLGDLQQNYLRGIGGYERKVQAYSATVTAQLGSFDLTALSGYNINSYHDSWDYTYFLGGAVQALFGVSGSPYFDDNKAKKFTQEIRLSTPIGQNVEWLFGAFYTHENSQYVQVSAAEDAATGQIVDQGLYLRGPTTYTEYAAFTDMTFHLTEKFDVQIGGRESHIRQTFAETESGPYVPAFFLTPSPLVVPEEVSTANAFTYLLTPKFKLSSDVMVYARLASGYRAGGANGREPGLPPQFNPDKTQNYELGVKGEFLDHMLAVDASAYYIDWKDIQLQLVDLQTGQSYTTNASRAKSQGLELSVESRPLTGLTIGSWIAWNDAELTERLPPGAPGTAVGAAGERLPFSSRFSGNLSLQQEFSLPRELTAFIGGVVSYVGLREGTFQATPSRQTYPAYTKADVRAGMRHDSWTANFFVTNITDRRGVLAGGLGSFPPFAFTYIQPRTVGLGIVKSF